MFCVTAGCCPLLDLAACNLLWFFQYAPGYDLKGKGDPQQPS